MTRKELNEYLRKGSKVASQVFAVNTGYASRHFLVAGPRGRGTRTAAQVAHVESVSPSRRGRASRKEASFISGQMLPLYLQLSLSLSLSLLNTPQFNYTTIRAMSRVL